MLSSNRLSEWYWGSTVRSLKQGKLGRAVLEADLSPRLGKRISIGKISLDLAKIRLVLSR